MGVLGVFFHCFRTFCPLVQKCSSVGSVIFMPLLRTFSSCRPWSLFIRFRRFRGWSRNVPHPQMRSGCEGSHQMNALLKCLFIHFGYFYSASSSPLLRRGALDYSINTVSELARQSTTGNYEWRSCPKSLHDSYSQIRTCDPQGRFNGRQAVQAFPLLILIVLSTDLDHPPFKKMCVAVHWSLF